MRISSVLLTSKVHYPRGLFMFWKKTLRWIMVPHDPPPGWEQSVNRTVSGVSRSFGRSLSNHCAPPLHRRPLLKFRRGRWLRILSRKRVFGVLAPASAQNVAHDLNPLCDLSRRSRRQGEDRAANTKQQLIGRVPGAQSHDQLPCVAHDQARNGNKMKADRLHPACYPLFAKG